MAWPFKNRLSDSGPAISLLWRSSGKDYQGELFFLRLLVPAEGDGIVGLGKATGQGLRRLSTGDTEVHGDMGQRQNQVEDPKVTFLFH